MTLRTMLMSTVSMHEATVSSVDNIFILWFAGSRRRLAVGSFEVRTVLRCGLRPTVDLSPCYR